MEDAVSWPLLTQPRCGRIRYIITRRVLKGGAEEQWQHVSVAARPPTQPQQQTHPTDSLCDHRAVTAQGDAAGHVLLRQVYGGRVGVPALADVVCRLNSSHSRYRPACRIAPSDDEDAGWHMIAH